MMIAQTYLQMYLLVFFVILLGALAVAVPRFRRSELLPPDPKEKQKQKLQQKQQKRR